MHSDPSGNQNGEAFASRETLRVRGHSTARPTDRGAIDWTGWLRQIERKRRLIGRLSASTLETTINPGMDSAESPRSLSRVMRIPSRNLVHVDVVAMTFSSFKLDGWDVTPGQVAAALAPVATGRVTPELRSRQSQRLRNHASILHHIESSLRLGEPLKAHIVVRWFTHLSNGLTGSGLDDEVMMRLDQIVRRINSPQLRLQAALQEISALHAKLMTEPLMPSYNGIVCRLLLRYHLGRCNLPAVIFDPATDGEVLAGHNALLRRLLVLIDESYLRQLSPR